MKFYDITQEVFTSEVYPGDIPPTYERQQKLKDGESCNLTAFKMGAHNGTHLDAPYHFFEEGKTIDQLELSKCIGYCTVVCLSQNPNLQDIHQVLKCSEKKLLIKGTTVVTLEMAKLFNHYHMELIGVESQSVGPVNAPKEVHLELLAQEVILLEGIRLENVPEGRYLLTTAPIKLGGSDGAPCRAVLIEI